MQDGELPLTLPRLDRWLSRRGRALPVLTVDGAMLLDGRLRVRRRAAAIGYGVGGLATAAWLASIATADVLRAGSANRAAVAWFAVGVALIAVAVLSWATLVRLGERRLAAGLTRRVSRDVAVPIWRRLGLLRSINCLIVGTASLAVLGALIALHAGIALISLFGGLFAVLAALSGVALYELVHAPVLAVDEGSLAADQLLRRESVYHAVYPLLCLVLTVGTQIGLLDGRRDPHLDMLAALAPGFVLPMVVIIDGLARRSEERPPGRPLLRWRGLTS